MRINKIHIQGFRAFKEPTSIDVGHFTTFVGKNDTGKSSILHAIDIFFNGYPDDRDFNDDQEPGAPIVLQLSFSEAPSSIQLEEGVNTTPHEEQLLDMQNNLTIKKAYSRNNPKKPRMVFLVEDFADVRYQNLCSFKEPQLNDLERSLGLDFRRAGAGITNKSKRKEIRDHAKSRNIPTVEVEIEPKEAALTILDYLPSFSLFRADEPLSEERTQFQTEFKTIIETAVGNIPEKEGIEKGVEDEIDLELQKIHTFLLQHTDEVASLKARPSFKWKDLVSFYIEGTDKQGKEIAFAKRGSGLRRLLMVAYFQYLAYKKSPQDSTGGYIYAIEEPETYLHPSAQRDLLSALKKISATGQVLITSHSPVFAGSTDAENLVLILRESGTAKVIQKTELQLAKVAEELGVEPSDQIYGFKAIVFVDGPRDCDFYSSVVNTLYNARKLPSTFEEKGIGLLPGGGEGNLKYWVNMKAIKLLNRRFALILESDRHSPTEPLSTEKERLRKTAELDGGLCFILRKREAENYLHPKVVSEKTGKEISFGDFDDVKVYLDDEIIGLIEHMTSNDILERDTYYDDGLEKHELLEICNAILSLAT